MGAVRAEVVVSWVALIAASLGIWGLGSDGVSLETTSRMIRRPFLEWLFPGMASASLETLHIFIRKVAHTAEYGVLALLMLRALLVTWTMRLAHAVVLALGYVLVLAAADEGRQAVSSMRKGTLTDVCLDLGGASLVLGAVQALPQRAKLTVIGRQE